MASSSATVLIEPDKETNKPGRVWERLKIKQNKQMVDKLNPNVEKMSEDKVRFVCISDTHSELERVKNPNFVPNGDVLLHAGDFTEDGTMEEIKQFNDYIGTLPHKYKIVISGNCDLALESVYRDSLENFADGKKYMKKDKPIFAKDLLSNCIYLEDSMVEMCGIKIYGSPWTPVFCDLAFNAERGEEILQKWNKIPADTDILMTHGPPVGYGDVTSRGQNVGCVELLNTVQQRVQPKYHVYGHVHADYGMLTDGTTTYINAATYKLVNPPVVFDYPIPEGYSKDTLSCK